MAARAEIRWGHTEHLRGRRVETRVGIEPSTVDRFCHCVAPRQFVSYSLRTVRSRIRFRRDAGYGFKDPMEVKTAHASGFGEGIEVRHVRSGLDQPAGLRHRCSVLCGECRLMRSAPFARPEAGLFSLFACGMETDMLAAGQPRRTGWPAIDAGRPHRIVKCTVRGAVAPHHCLPPCIVARERRRGASGLCHRWCTRLLHYSFPL